MITALNEKGNRVLSFEAQGGEIYRCPECNEVVELKDGRFDHHHGTSSVHDEIKYEIFNALYDDEDVDVIECEYSMDGCRPDIYFETKGYKVAIEIQKRHLTLETIEERTRILNENDVAVMWIYPEGGPFTSKTYGTKALERYLEEIMSGSIFYRFKGGIVAMFLFEKVMVFDRNVNRDIEHNYLRKAKEVGLFNIVTECSPTLTEDGLLLWRP